MRMMKAVIVAVALLATYMDAGDGLYAAEIPSVTYNHFDDSPALFKIDIDPGRYYIVNIADSCPTYFKVRSEGVPAGQADQPNIQHMQDRKAGVPGSPPQNINEYLKNTPKNMLAIDCYIDPDTKNKVAHQVGHGENDGGARIRIEYSDEYGRTFPDPSHAVTALRIKKDSLEPLNQALKANYDLFQTKIDNIDAAAKAKCNEEEECKNLPPDDLSRVDKIKKYTAKLADEYKETSDSAIRSCIETYTETKKLTPSMFTVAANSSDWRVELAGAFTVSSLTDKKYGTEMSTNGDNVVVRQKDKEDDASLGLAAFIHIANPGLADECKNCGIFNYWTPLSFGLGINDANAVSYFVGTSVRFSDKAYLTLGYNWGPTNTLPSGIKEGSIVSDPNALSNEGTRTGGGVFFAISYSFLSSNSPSTLHKPFLDPKK